MRNIGVHILIKNMSDKVLQKIYYLPCDYSKRLIDKLQLLSEKLNCKLNLTEITKAISYAKKYHSEQYRQSGEPYYSHPLEVAYMLAQYAAQNNEKYFRTDLLITAILHDTLEDTELTFEIISHEFGEVIAKQVLDLTRIKQNGYKTSAADTIKKLWKQKKYDVLLVKYFDRLHNLQTINAKSPEKIKKITRETLRYCLILSEIMEMPKIADSLYELCYEANVALGIIPKNSFVLDKPFNLDKTFPAFESKIH